MRVKVWSEAVVIPTYEIGEAEKNPMFLEKRVYQGSSGVVYPYPVVEKISDSAVDKSYEALWIENEYIKVMILPELGGRVQMAYDKIKERHFIYYNSVIKPALVGLTGPWISGGIEFNWPQHHRPSTFLPIDWSIEEYDDGSATVWVSERERMFHQRAAAGFTLYPGRAVVEIRGRLYNPTQIPQTFLWWANPAVAVNEHYQSVFPSDVNAVFDHGKRDVSSFPIAKGTYYKVDYSPGTDISRYSNIPVPTSYMAINSKYNFVGGYENDSRAGLLHVADHHISPGKKQWTWGYGDFGRAWDRNLTDSDGPYIELMTGVYTDNQPDFSWLQPYEEKRFTQYFMPYRDLGVVKNASADFMLNLEVEGGMATVKVFATSKSCDVNIQLSSSDRIYLDCSNDLSPEEVFIEEVAVGDITIKELTLTIMKDGRELLGWKAEECEPEMPESAQAAQAPSEIDSIEELYLAGLHIEQYRHATYSASDYYREALRRDSGDIRANNAMGLWLLRRGEFSESLPYFEAAIKRLTKHNPNPYDGEAYYNYGVALKYLGESDRAYDNIYKACWNSAWQDSGHFALSQISAARGSWQKALYHVDASLSRNATNLLALHLKVATLRKLGKDNSAEIARAMELDKFNFGVLYERTLVSNDSSLVDEFVKIMRQDSHNYIELAADYLGAGMYEEVISLLELALKYCRDLSAMVYYYIAYAKYKLGDKGYKVVLEDAAKADPSYCFPNKLEDILVLESATKLNVSDSKALYYLGNLWYDKRRYGRVKDCLERSIEIDPSFPTAKRNLALIYFNKLDRPSEALALLEQAFALDSSDARVLMELDQLYKRLQYPYLEREALLSKHMEQVESRDDLYLEYITLQNQLGRYDRAMELISSRQFHPWEGGEGKVAGQYQLLRVELAKEAILCENYERAIELLEECYSYPHNLGEGKLPGAQENDFNYWMGCALTASGQDDLAKRCFELASVGLSEPCDAIYYNDQRPDKIFYQALAHIKLGNLQQAEMRLNRLVEYGKENLGKSVRIDYFAVSLPDLLIWDDDLDRRNDIHCHYMMGLGYYGLGRACDAISELKKALELDLNHQGVQCHLDMFERFSLL